MYLTGGWDAHQLGIAGLPARRRSNIWRTEFVSLWSDPVWLATLPIVWCSGHWDEKGSKQGWWGYARGRASLYKREIVNARLISLLLPYLEAYVFSPFSVCSHFPSFSVAIIDSRVLYNIYWESSFRLDNTPRWRSRSRTALPKSCMYSSHSFTYASFVLTSSIFISKKLQFSIFNNQDAVKISEFEVTHRDLYTPIDRLPVKDGVLDRRLVRSWLYPVRSSFVLIDFRNRERRKRMRSARLVDWTPSIVWVTMPTLNSSFLYSTSVSSSIPSGFCNVSARCVYAAQ